LFISTLLGVNAFAQTLIQDFNIILPNHTSRVEAGGILTIKWSNYSYSARDISRLNVYVVKKNKVIYTVAKNILNNGKYIMKLPSDFNPGGYRIKIASIDDSSSALSEEFKIIAEIPIKIMKPDSSSIWKQDGEYTIRWRAEGDKAYINLLKMTKDDKFVSRLKIADTINNNGEYLWHIPYDLEDGTYIIEIRIPPIKEVKYSVPFVIRRTGNK